MILWLTRKKGKFGGAGLRARLWRRVALVAQAFQPVRPHRQDAGATKNFSDQELGNHKQKVGRLGGGSLGSRRSPIIPREFLGQERR